MALDANAETFIVYVAILSVWAMQAHLFCHAQIELLLADKAPIKVSPKYFDYVDIFLFDFGMELLENTGIN